MSKSRSSASSSSRGSDDPPVIMPYRRRGQKSERDAGKLELEESAKSVRKLLSSGGSVAEVETIQSVFDQNVEQEEKTAFVPQRTFEFGKVELSTQTRKNSFLTTGYVGVRKDGVAYRPKDNASAILMKPGLGTAMRREDARYGQNLASALAGRGLVTNRRVLVLGSGCASSMAQFFNKMPSSVLCVDNNPVKVSVLESLVSQLDMDGVVSVVEGDARKPEDFAKPGELFDLILVTKSFGAIITSDGHDAHQVVTNWLSLLSPDGVLAIDTQTFGRTASSNGHVSGCFRGEDCEIATVFGRYDDKFYNLDKISSDLRLTVRECLNLSVRGNCGKQGEPLVDSEAQMWVMYLFSVTPRTLVPVVPHKSSFPDEPVTVTDDILEMEGGTDLLSPAVKGSKIVPWKGLGDIVCREHVYPKFDGMPGMMMFADGQLTFISAELTFTKSAVYHRDRYCFIAEVCQGRVSGGIDVPIIVILGIYSIEGIHFDPNDMKTLESNRHSFESMLRPFGVVVTSPSLLLSLRKDVVRVPALFNDKQVHLDIPVDGLNVSVGGAYGNFVKPKPLCTVDLENDQSEDLEEAVSMGMLDAESFAIEWAKEPGVWEYGLRGGVLRPRRKRTDKRRGATVVRIAQDLAACAAMDVVIERADSVWELYNSMVNRMSTYIGSRNERRQFF
ncbi:methyltransferase [Hadaka virus 1]|uniref:Methyltransferase n=1 Tax=Hadaka virus 1 TaxID=2703488 RepID=A0A6J4BJJ8_9VIRU|nr:methyltransferase [Hadaka virus 1]BBU94040.1 methyltransferase [Hadaka virus 1]